VTELYFIDVVGAWIGIFLTLCILSFLYKDNPFYKFAEHLFVGVSIGYLVSQQYYNVMRPKLVDELAAGFGGGAWTHWLALVPLVLFLAMVVKTVSRKFAWVGRYPLAFVVALFAGLQINAVAQAELGAQIKRAMKDIDTKQVDLQTASVARLTPLPGFTPAIAEKVVAARDAGAFVPTAEGVQALPSLTDAERGIVADNRGTVKGLDAQTGKGRYWFGIVSNILLLLGTLTSLLYFYFSLATRAWSARSRGSACGS